MTQLSQIWLEILEVAHLEDDDHFFEMGGNSFTALRLLDRIRAEYGVEVDLGAFFADPTLGAVREIVRAGS